MRDVYMVSDNIISPIGVTSAANFNQLTEGVSGIRLHEKPLLSETPFFASLFNETDGVLSKRAAFTKFEQLLVASISEALKHTEVDPADNKTVFIISSTKGNIDLLENENGPGSLNKGLFLQRTAKKIATHFQFANEPLVVSNACISGLLAMITGQRLIRSGKYEHAVVAGADIISKFVLSGFQSFQAVSNEPCKPFDEARNGITLGEAAGTVIFSANKALSKGIKLAGGSVSNDANHISGPSRTGEELYLAINKAMNEAVLGAKDINFISTHGTATIYNDEMEAKAINLAGLQSVPLNSLKGYYGHSLGAAGMIETIISAHSLLNAVVIPTKGFSRLGVTQPVNVCNSLQNLEINNCLKTASGFGGCNAAIIISKQ